jgi:FkbM family methyltransferase
MRAAVELVRDVVEGFDRRVGTDYRHGLPAAVHVSAAVAPDPLAAAWVFAATLLMASRRWSRRLTLRVKGPTGPVPFVVPDVSGIYVLREVFSYREYAVALPRPPRRILDLGSNIGATILDFATRYPGARITGVEASPRLFRILQRNVGHLPDVTLLNAAVAAEEGPVAFYEGVESWAGSLRASPSVRRGAGTRVDGIPLDVLIERTRPDLVKVDVEGAEFDVLPAWQRLREVDVVMGEIHAGPATAQTRELLRAFDRHELVRTPDYAQVESTVFSAVRWARPAGTVRP